MKTTGIPALAAALLSILVLGSCALNLEPAWKNSAGRATLRMDFSQSGVDSRAISLGTGYLYIRTVGGPEGDNGPTYGPYTVSTSGVFATSDIPAGSYSKFCIAYSAVSLENNAAFKSLVSLSDADFVAQAIGTTAMEQALDGDASGVILDDVTLVEGAINLVSAVLKPFIYEPSAYSGTYVLPVDATYGTIYLPDAGSSMDKKFIRVTGAYDDPVNYYTIQCEVDAYTVDPCSVAAFRLYDSNGRLLYARSNTAPISANSPLVYTFANPGGTDFYIYIEYTYDPIVIFSIYGAL